MIEIIKKYWLRTVIILVVACSLSLTYLFVNMNQGSFSKLFYYVDAFFIGGSATVCFGMLSLVTYYGAFDFVSYAFMGKNENGKRVDFADYLEDRKERNLKRKNIFVPYFIIGLIFIAIAMTLYLFL